MNLSLNGSVMLLLRPSSAARTLVAAAGAALGIQTTACAAEPVDFAREIRPILQERCVKCHGAEKQKGGLRFDHQAGALKAGDSGEQAIIAGHAGKSELMRLVRSSDADEWMPPKGERLSAREIDLLRLWIDGGAEWPESAAPTQPGANELAVTEEDRRHWAYLPLSDITPPEVKTTAWARTPVDQFILAALEKKGLQPATPANPRKLVRRIYFDLIGLPPAPAEVEAFVETAERAPEQAVGQLVERLLASPHHGERWGRHWLDVARYADSNGQEGDQDRPTAYHYRDFVIRAFNDDLSFDRFARWQLAGDELEPDNPQAIAATGFIVAGPHTVLDVPMEEEKIRNRFNELDDMLATTGQALLGLTLGCARCHDHKYDAIPTRDYYRMQSAFLSGNRAEVPLVPQAEAAEYRRLEAAWKQALEPVRKQFDAWLAEQKKPLTAPLRAAKIEALPIRGDEKILLMNDPDAPRAKELARKHAKALKLEDHEFRKLVSGAQGAEWDRRARELEAIEARKPKAPPTALAMADFGPSPKETWLLDRGDFQQKREPVQLGFLSVLTRGRSPEEFWAAARNSQLREDSTQQRRALAEWITDLEHGPGALLARVIVNRVWQHHFGEGLVRTESDFGVQGEPPSHPELLEWLSAEFVRSGWSLKALHRLLMTSAVYLQESIPDSAKARVDPENRWLSRRRPQRLEAEILRDSVLAVSGRLNPQAYGPAFKAPILPEAIQARNLKTPYPTGLADSAETHRRTVYMFHKRVVQHPLMQAFDAPDAQASCGRRNRTTVAPQALALLNDQFIRARAVDFAGRLEREAGAALPAQVTRAFQLALGREPEETEQNKAVGFLRSQADRRRSREEPGAAAAHLALVDFCQTIFALNEFIYVD